VQKNAVKEAAITWNLSLCLRVVRPSVCLSEGVVVVN